MSPLYLGSAGQDSSSQGSSESFGQVFAQEETPSLIDGAGPTVSLIPSESVITMAAGLNACGPCPLIGKLTDGIEKAVSVEPTTNGYECSPSCYTSFGIDVPRLLLSHPFRKMHEMDGARMRWV